MGGNKLRTHSNRTSARFNYNNNFTLPANRTDTTIILSTTAAAPIALSRFASHVRRVYVQMNGRRLLRPCMADGNLCLSVRVQ